MGCSFLWLCLSLLILHHFSPPWITVDAFSRRHDFEVIIGGGGNGDDHPPEESSASSPCYSPAPAPPLSIPLNLIRDALTLKKLASQIKVDPFGIVKTWTGSNPCSFTGIECAVKPGDSVLSVAVVDFNGFNLAGGLGESLNVQGFIDNLPDIAIYHSNSNRFSGSVSVPRAKNLYELDLSNNNFLGAFPLGLLQAQNLSYLDIRFNKFEGQLPAAVFNLNLDVLFLNNNCFEGEIPKSIGLSSAYYMNFANNLFSGSIPAGIGHAPNLVEVLFLNNQLSGCLPYEIGMLKELTVFDAGENHITGPIPLSFVCLMKLEEFNMASNQLHGAIPEELCAITTILNISLSNNYFTQVGPTCRALVDMKKMDLRNNCILGFPDQREPQECENFLSKAASCENEWSSRYIPCQAPSYHDQAPQRWPHMSFAKVASGKTRHVTYNALNAVHG